MPLGTKRAGDPRSGELRIRESIPQNGVVLGGQAQQDLTNPAHLLGWD